MKGTNNLLKTTVAEVRTPVSLSEDQEKNLLKILVKIKGKGIKLSYRIDKSVLSGFVVLIGDWYLDASLSTDLKNLRENLI